MRTWLVLLVGCGPMRPPKSPVEGTEWTWDVDRSSLPAATLRVVHVATAMLEPGQVVAGPNPEKQRGPISVFVLEHPTEGVVLLDAGYGALSQPDFRAYPGRTVRRTIGLEMVRPAAQALPDIGHRPEDVRRVVLTHGHHDHAGGIADFPAAVVHADAAECAAMYTKRLLKGYDPVPYADRPCLPVAWRDEPYGPFPAHADLFGDGSVVLLPAAGHTPGSVLVLVNLPTRSVLYLGDAAWVDAGWQGPRPKGWLVRRFMEADWRGGLEVLWRVKAWHERHPELLVVAGHEASNVEKLPTWPAPL